MRWMKRKKIMIISFDLIITLTFIQPILDKLARTKKLYENYNIPELVSVLKMGKQYFLCHFCLFTIENTKLKFLERFSTLVTGAYIALNNLFKFIISFFFHSCVFLSRTYWNIHSSIVSHGKDMEQYSESIGNEVLFFNRLC